MSRGLNRQVRNEVTKLCGVIYARASNDRRGRKISAASQVKKGKRFFKQHNITLVKVLIDNDISSSRYSTKERPDYQEALRLLRSGEANLLWTWENSRAQRNLDIFVVLRKLLEQTGGFWAYDERIYDMRDADDRIQVTEDALDSEKESEKIAKRSRRGVETRAWDGWWHGPLSYGYRRVFHERTGEALRQEHDQEQAPIVTEIVRRVLAEESETRIAMDLDARGVPCPREQAWTAWHVRRLDTVSRDAAQWRQLMATLTKEQVESAYEAVTELGKGESPSLVARGLNRGQREHVWPGRWCSSKVRGIALNPVVAGLRVWRGEVIVTGNWKPIITVEQHEMVKARLADPARANRKDGRRVKHLLSGDVMPCGVCGERTSCTFVNGAHSYRCKDGCVGRRKAVVDTYVVEVLLARLEAADAAEFFRVGAGAGVAEAVAEAKALRARLTTFVDAAAEGQVDAAALARITAKLSPKIDAADKRVQALGVAPVLAGIVGPQARTVWAGLAIEQQRAIIRATMRPKLLKAKRGRTAFDPNTVPITWLNTPVEPARLRTAS